MFRVAAAKPLQCTLVRRVSTSFSSHGGTGGSLEGYTPPTTSPANDMIAQLAAKHLDRLSLKDLIRFGRPPLTTQSLLTSARFTREYLPVRLSRRIRALRNLPYIIVSNPNISTIYNNYIDSLTAILAFPAGSLTNLTEESKFTELLTEIVKTHSNTIPILAKGFLECRGYVTPEEATKFLDHHLRARIGTRLMAEQHIGLHLASVPQPPTVSVPGKSYIGTVDTELRPAEIIESCASFVGDICELRYGTRPKLTIDGNPDITFPYIPVHLEYIITELLKNAFRATIEANSPVPVIATIAAAPGPPDAGGITIRIRDQGGGIAPDDLCHIWSYSFSTFNGSRSSIGSGNSGRLDDVDGGGADGGVDVMGRLTESAGALETSSIAGLGYGLPMSRAYAQYFGGSLKVQSAYEWGTDVYLRLKGVGLDGV
ncbi:branched-chain alpha-ketoacid dehydrogenase [Tuber indicum]|nr:branched-chain alpha-ketoacid dehydrogenase [Tuber indicum]